MQKNQDVVIVTGASRRLGWHLCRALLAQGYVVVGTYRQPSPEVDQLIAEGVQMMRVDVSQVEEVDRWLDTVCALYPVITAVIHNASLWCADAALGEDAGLLASTFALHIWMPHRINMRLHPLLMKASGKANIIFMSDANVPYAKADHSLYLASKAGMESMMRSQAQAFAPDVRVNAIAPGLLAFYDEDSPAYRARRLSHSLVGLEPGFDVAVDAVLFVLRNPYVNATVLTLDGGRASSTMG